MDYDEITSTLLVLAAIPRNSEDSNYEKVLPAAFAYAEGRIYRELNFLATDIYTYQPLIANVRDAVISPDVIHVRSVNILTPVGPVDNNTRRHPLERISAEALDMFWPNPGFKKGLPKKYTVIGVRTTLDALPNPAPPTTQPLPPIPQPERFTYWLRVMPTPDKSYMTEVYGGVQPQPLSQTNPETYLSVRYPDLFLACCMVFITGYQRDYGAHGRRPATCSELGGAVHEITRRHRSLKSSLQRSEGPSWTAAQPAPMAQQQRSP